MSEIRCHNGYCSFNSAMRDCPLCHGRGWHYCGGVVADAKLMAGTPYDSIEWARHRYALAAPTDKPEKEG